jgi:hypothetical protein
MADFEPVAAALLERLKDVGDVTYASRYRIGLDTLPDQPAVIVVMAGATVTPEHGRPSKWVGQFEVGYIARSDGGEETPESRLNAWLVELQAAMAPGEGEKVNTLGETCEHAWLSGSVEFVPPSRENPWMECWSTVEVLVVG